jgi:hypothetical protein
MDDRASRETYGVARGATGTHTGDGTVLTVTLGYRPKRVELVNMTDNTVWTKIDGMPENTTLKDAAGTPTVDTTSAIQIVQNGFVVSAAANIAAKAMVWAVF